MSGSRNCFKASILTLIFATFFVPYYSYADSSNGTGGGTQSPPGQAGGHNPHGSPPGQGGGVPGSSGSHNPQGTPPGQRIGGPGTAAGGNPGSVGSGGNSPAPQNSGQGIVTKMIKISAKDASSADKSRWLNLEREVNTLQGWEPDWYIASMRFFRCSVSSRLTMTASGWGYSKDLKIERDGDAERGWERLNSEVAREWFRRYPDVWSRLEGGKWTQGTVGPASITFPGTYTVMIAYSAYPVWVRKTGIGPVTYGFSMINSGDTMEIEADRVGGLVRKIRRLNSLGRREWEEERTQEIREGKAVLLSRVRRMYLPIAGEIRETCIWDTGPETAFTSAMVPPK